MEMFFEIAGGLGLFLLGMALLTDGLKAFSGSALRGALVRFTGRPIKAFASGFFATLMIQSSSATTITVIGFVSAGLLTFPQAIGVVFGASLGTTGTGWIIAAFGLKISLGLYTLPLIAIGAFIHMLAPGRWQQLGLALAGFGLIFVGIDTLQLGMGDAAGRLNLAGLSSAGLIAHLLAMIAGVVMTVLMQSSSAAVATTLTALHSGAVNFEQAASLVIGAAIGTTVTGVLASIGGSIPAKRTALAHVLFNLGTGLIAIVLLPGYLWWIKYAQVRFGLDEGAMSLVAFHTAFIAVGVIMFLPFVRYFARFIEWVVPDRGPLLTRHLDKSLLQTPAVALEATQRALRDTACALMTSLDTRLGPAKSGGEFASRVDVQQALEQIQEFLARIPSQADAAAQAESRVSQMHAIDHLMRLQSRMQPPPGVQRMLNHERLTTVTERTRHILQLGIAGLRDEAPEEWLATMQRESSEMAAQRLRERPAILHQAADDWTPPQILALLDAIRWVERIAYHAWRTCNYLGGDGTPELLPSMGELAQDE